MSKKIEWGEAYRVGILDFDNAHKQLIALINEVITAAVENRGENIFNEVISDLIKYTEEHFGREERLLELTKYPRLEEHKTQHKALVENVFKFASQYIEDEVNIEGLIKLLSIWIFKHIQDHDMKYAHHFHDLGIN